MTCTNVRRRGVVLCFRSSHTALITTPIDMLNQSDHSGIFRVETRFLSDFTFAIWKSQSRHNLQTRGPSLKKAQPPSTSINKHGTNTPTPHRTYAQASKNLSRSHNQLSHNLLPRANPQLVWRRSQFHGRLPH